MLKYLPLALLFVVLSFGAGVDEKDGTACGLGVSAGLCVLAAAVEDAGRRRGSG